MSNFLQRIASAVAPAQGLAQPQLRPMMGSVFGPAVPLAIFSEHGRQGKTGWDLHESDTRQSLPFHTEPALLRPNTSESARDSAASFEAAHTRGWHSNTGDRDRLLLPAYDADAHRGSEGNHPPDLFAEDSVLAGRLSQTNADAGAGTSRISPISSQTLASTTLPVIAMSHAAPSIQPRQVLSGPVVRSTRAEPAASREPDEIHIHIGRIEVAPAVPQPQRPSAVSARRAPSLDEYLRQNGRRG